MSSSFVRERDAAKSECLKFLHQQLFKENIKLEDDVLFWLTNEMNGKSYIPVTIDTKDEFTVAPFSLKKECKFRFYYDKLNF